MMEDVELIQQIRQEIEWKINQKLTEKIRDEGDVNEILKNLDCSSIEREICNKYVSLNSFSVSFSREEIWSSFATDYINYTQIIQQLNYKNPDSTRLGALNLLLDVHSIDIQQKDWNRLSKVLQKCLSSPNREIFRRTLQVHIKIIQFPGTSNEGYLNLIQALISCNNRNSNLNNKNNRNVLQALKLVLNFQKFIIRSWLNVKEKVIEEILANFIILINTKLISEEKSFHLYDFLSVLDTDANWFKYFCYGLRIRTIFLNCLKKNSNFLKYVFYLFLTCTFDKVNEKNVNFIRFLHSINFLKEFVKYKQALAFFPIKADVYQESVTFTGLILLTINRINSNHNRLRSFLIDFLKTVLNSNVLNDYEVLHKLFLPINTKLIDKRNIYGVINKNRHILDIFNEHLPTVVTKNLSSSTSQRTSSLNESLTSRSQNSVRSSRQKSINPAQTVISLTLFCLRHYINHSEVHKSVDGIVFELMRCCGTLFTGNCNVQAGKKLMECLRDFYAVISNTANYSYKLETCKLLKVLLENYSNSFEILSRDSYLFPDIISIIVKNSNFWDKSDRGLCKLIVIISKYKNGGLIKENHKDLITPHLERIWFENEKSENFLSNPVTKFLCFIFPLSFEIKAVQALLTYENEGTIVEDDEKPCSLSEIIENCLNVFSHRTVENYLGLLVLRILITNLDVMLHLQQIFRLKENLIELQVNSRICDYEEIKIQNSIAMVIDEFSVLRHNILLSIKYAGVVNEKLNSDVLNQTQLISSPLSNNSALGRRQVMNELQRFLHDSKPGLHDHGWLLQARRAFKSVCRDNYKVSILVSLIEQVSKNFVGRTQRAWPSSDTILSNLFEEDYNGVTTVVRFGIQNGLLLSTMANQENLVLLLRQSKVFLHHAPNEFTNFDWFVSVIFLITTGNLDKSQDILSTIINMSVGSILWSNLAPDSAYDNFYQSFELVMEENPALLSALKMLGFSSTDFVKKWLNQCFFNILEFDEICKFLTIVFLYPSEYIILFMVALFEHIKENIFLATHTMDIQDIINMTQIVNFRIGNYLIFMDKLAKRHRNLKI